MQVQTSRPCTDCSAASFETTFQAQRCMRPTTMPNATAAELALHLGAQGAALIYDCACASSAAVGGEALRAIRAGWIDVGMRVLSPRRSSEDASGICRPFSADRAGFALDEDAAALVLKSEAHARAVRSPHCSWPATRPIATANAAEAQSIASVFGNSTAVSSTKAIHGHLLGAGVRWNWWPCCAHWSNGACRPQRICGPPIRTLRWTSCRGQHAPQQTCATPCPTRSPSAARTPCSLPGATVKKGRKPL
ncbi:hypothetical protein B2J86_13125 [Acidovorax sp. SRB_14]|nr:hypothetical protein [Acidovorax sp. SRB_14]